MLNFMVLYFNRKANKRIYRFLISFEKPQLMRILNRFILFILYFCYTIGEILIQIRLPRNF